MAFERKIAPLGVIVRTLIGIVVLVGAIGVFAFLKATKPEAARTPRAEVGRVVQVVEAAAVRVDRAWEGYGTARAMRAADVVAEVSERVIERPGAVEEGAWIEAGGLIAALEPRPFADRVEEATQAVARLTANLQAIDVEEPSWGRALELAQDAARITRSEIEKMRAAVAEGGGIGLEVERLERELTLREREVNELARTLALIPSRRADLTAQKRAAEAALATARRDLELSRMVSPIAGVLQSVEVDVGERVQVGAPVARVVDLRRMEIPVLIPLSASAFVRIGDRAVVRTDAPSGGGWTGRVSRIAPESDPSRRSLTVFVEVEQEVPRDRAPGLVPGAFVRATVYTGVGAERVVLPRASVNGDRVMIVNGQGVAESRRVEVAYFTDGRFPEIHALETEWAVLASGVGAGERVIVSNLDEVFAGESIAGVPAGAAGAGGSPPVAAESGRDETTTVGGGR